MTDITTIVQRTFEDIRMTDETGFEFWDARTLMTALGYKKWERFGLVIEKAKENCTNSGGDIGEHFMDEYEFFQEAGKTRPEWRPRENYFLTRYACYLVALNGDSRFPEISLAKSYFASQTRKLEIQEQRIDENKRIDARRKLAENEAKIEETVYTRGISLPVEFATFKNKWIQALYTISVKWLKQKRWIPENRALADFDTEVELRAKDFIYAMTDHNIRENDIQWKNALEEELISSSHATRAALLRRGITPEDLTPQEDLKQIGKRREKEEKYLDTGM
jgi:DNA-damage-inducible protein D